MKILFILLTFFSSLTYAQNVKTYIPPQAFDHKGTIFNEISVFFPDLPEYNYVPALIEHESCIGLRHSRCWNSKSRLKTSREEGAGLGFGYN